MRLLSHDKSDSEPAETEPHSLVNEPTAAPYNGAESEGTEKPYRQTRRWRRHKVDVPIRVVVHRSGKTSLFDGRGNELSEGGMALTAGVELLPGDTIDIEFAPPVRACPFDIPAS
jgi:PilZ domain